MTTYRCPACGASHKEPVAACRLCGQGMGAQSEMPMMAPKGRDASFSKYRPQSVMPYVLGGLALVVVLGVAAVVFGFADSNELGDAAKDVPGIGSSEGSWPSYEDPDGRFTAVLPVEEPSVSEVELLGTQATITEASIGDQVELGIIWLENPTLEGDTTLGTLRPIAEQFAALSNAEIDGEVVEGSYRGQPAIVVTASGFNYEGGPGYLQMRIVRLGDDVVILATTSNSPNADQHSRLIDGFQPTTADSGD